MERKPAFSGKVADKDERDILYWYRHKTPKERLEEAWRLHCLNHGADPAEVRLDKSRSCARKRP